MRDLFEKIQELEDIPTYSKHEQLVQGVINAIQEKLLTKGQALPSVNNMIKEFGFARETIMKAYTDLKNRGIIESKNRLGYFVANEAIDQTLNVALLMYGFDTFQEIFYRNFRETLGENIHVDVFFHHNNIEVFETILGHIKGKYGMYVVAPIPHPKTAGLLQSIPTNKFLMFDRYEPMEGDFSYITQEFEESTYRAFVTLADAIKKFDEMIFFYQPASAIPIEILRSYKKFCKNFQVNGTIKVDYIAGSLEKGKVYFTLNNANIVSILKDCKIKNYKLGEDFAILSHNDEPVKEILWDGITTYSVDFGEMGRKAANYVLTRKKVQEILPTVLIRRNSL
jgi:DNA-binding transcriptional regulator YhcF (GntR family)/DNA-binding LacI/PurR family transcriptional regulator